jgi:Ca2+:H+ antiporter
MTTASQLSSSLLLLAVIAVIIPSAFHFAVNGNTSGGSEMETLTDAVEANDLLAMSHGVAVILLVR